MKNLNSFFVIGTVGMIISAFLHIFLAVVLAQSSVHSTFWCLYPTFIAFLAIGAGQMVKERKASA